MRIKQTILIIFALSIYATLLSCSAEEVAAVNYYSLNGKFHDADGTNRNGQLKAIEVPCKDNNTLRLYYSDSVETLGFPDHLAIVPFTKAGHLGYRECYLEASSSATDTWLSIGVDSLQQGVVVTDNKTKFTFNYAKMQHFTSVPLNEFGLCSGQLFLK